MCAPAGGWFFLAFVFPHSPQPPRPAGRGGANADSRFDGVAPATRLLAKRRGAWCQSSDFKRGGRSQWLCAGMPTLAAARASRLRAGTVAPCTTVGDQPGRASPQRNLTSVVRIRRKAAKSAVRFNSPSPGGARGLGGVGKYKSQKARPQSKRKQAFAINSEAINTDPTRATSQSIQMQYQRANTLRMVLPNS